MTDEDKFKLEDLEKIHSKATQGKWNYHSAGAYYGEVKVTKEDGSLYHLVFNVSNEDALFIAEVHKEIPRLIAIIRRLQGHLDKLWAGN